MTDYPATKWSESAVPGDGHHHKIAAYIRAYEMMAKAKVYRPNAPGNGFGSVDLTPAELADPARLREEACRFAYDLWDQDEKGKFEIHGCPDSAAMTLLGLALALAELTFGGDLSALGVSDHSLSGMAKLITEEAARVEAEYRRYR